MASSPPTPAERAAQAPQRGPRLLFVAVVFALLLTYPLLGAFDRPTRVAGVPILYLYVLLTWLALVALTGWLARSFDK